MRENNTKSLSDLYEEPWESDTFKENVSFFFEICVKYKNLYRFWMQKKLYQKLDLIIFLLVLTSLFIDLFDGTLYDGCQNFIEPFIDALKIMRMFKLMRKSDFFFFRAMSKLSREIMSTLFHLWDFIAIIVIIMVVCAFIGLELLRSSQNNYSQ